MTQRVYLEIGSTVIPLGDFTQAERDILERSIITHQVIRTLLRRQVDGALEHGGPMQPGDPEPHSIEEALAEAIDMAQYLTKATMEGVG